MSWLLSGGDRYHSQQLAIFTLPLSEDVVLSKLHWGQQSQSEKQWRDVLGILKTQRNLDLSYSRERAIALDLEAALEQTFVEAGAV